MRRISGVTLYTCTRGLQSITARVVPPRAVGDRPKPLVQSHVTCAKQLIGRVQGHHPATLSSTCTFRPSALSFPSSSSCIASVTQKLIIAHLHVLDYFLSRTDLTAPTPLNYLSAGYLGHIREFMCLIPSPHFITWHLLIRSFSS